jgi:hypothetical protein
LEAWALGRRVARSVSSRSRRARGRRGQQGLLIYASMATAAGATLDVWFSTCRCGLCISHGVVRTRTAAQGSPSGPLGTRQGRGWWGPDSRPHPTGLCRVLLAPAHHPLQDEVFEPTPILNAPFYPVLQMVTRPATLEAPLSSPTQAGKKPPRHTAQRASRASLFDAWVVGDCGERPRDVLFDGK